MYTDHFLATWFIEVDGGLYLCVPQLLMTLVCPAGSQTYAR